MPASSSRSRRTSRVLLRWAGRLLALAFALVVAGALVVVVVLPRATQGAAMTVLTGSMTPGIPVGSIVMVRPVDPATLEVGDVATYQRKPGSDVYITHRITKIDLTPKGPRYTFKGDANRTPDMDPVRSAQIRGEVWFHVPYLGAIRDGLHGRGGVTLWATLLLAAYALSQVGAGLRDRKARLHGSPLHLPVNRPLLAVTLDVGRVASRLAHSPAEAAAAWGGVLVHEDDRRCTVLLALGGEDVGAQLEKLLEVEPVEVLVLEEPGVLSGPTARTVTRPVAEGARVAS